MKQLMYSLSYLRILFLAISMCAVTSCDKVTEITEKAKEMANSLTGDEDEIPISEEELEASDAALEKCIDTLEKVPSILTQVRNEKTAIEARKQIDVLTEEIAEVLPDLARIEGEGEKRLFKVKRFATGEAGQEAFFLEPQLFYILEENREAYQIRGEKVIKQIVFQVVRLDKVTRESPIAVDIILNGISGLGAGTVEGANSNAIPAGIQGGSPAKVPAGVSGSGSKSWLPPGVTIDK